MSLTHRWTAATASAAIVLAVGAITVFAQLPIPVQGQRGGQAPPLAPQPGQPGQRGGGRGSQPAPAPDPPPVVSAIATASPEVTGPGKFFETLMELKPGDDLAHFGYVTKEYFVSGTANGEPYKTRIVIRRPADNSRFSGLVLAESMHPSGNPWMFHFTHTYSMTEGTAVMVTPLHCRQSPTSQRAADETGTAHALPCSRSSAVIPLFLSPKM